jgi:hypothetical protein
MVFGPDFPCKLSQFFSSKYKSGTMFRFRFQKTNCSSTACFSFPSLLSCFPPERRRRQLVLQLFTITNSPFSSELWYMKLLVEIFLVWKPLDPFHCSLSYTHTLRHTQPDIFNPMLHPRKRFQFSQSVSYINVVLVVVQLRPCLVLT